MSLHLGQDANWDLLNYHLYNGAAWLQGRFDQDLLAAGMQSYLNPLLDALYAGLALGPLRTHPRLLAAAMGLWFGAALYFAARLAMLLHEGRPAPVLAAMLLGATGAAMVAQIGTTTGELQAGAIMLAGLFVLLRGTSGAKPAVWAILAAGALFGVAGGLKLTAVAYAPAACLAAASLHRPGRMLAACAWFSAGWLAGFVVSDGWWALQLHHRFGSPVFPLFNGVFRSPWYPPASVLDDRFLPRGIVQWLFYPLFWTGNQAAGPNEAPFRDLRGAAALCLGAAAILAWVLRLQRDRPAFTPRQRAVLVFLAVGYATWLATSSILRYAVVIEVVAGLVIPLLLARLVRGRAGLGALAAVVGLLVATTRYLPSSRVPYGAETLRADMDWVEPGMLVVVTFRGPSTHVMAMMPRTDGVSVMNVGNTVLEARGWRLHDEVERRVREHGGRIVVVTEGHVQGRFPELGEIGLDPALTNCRSIASTFVPASATGVHACDARKLDRPRLTSPFWAEAALRYRTVVQPMDATQSLVGAAYLDAVGPAGRGTRFIDWADLLWSGVRNSRAPLPPRPDARTLYVLGPEHVTTMAARLDPTADALGRVDGLLVAAPGWRRCPACTALIGPVRIARPEAALSVGDISVLGPQAWASGTLRDGWWPQEATGSWSQEQADMAIPLSPDLPEAFTLVLTGMAFTGPGLPVQRVVAEVAGQPASEAPQSLAGKGAIRVPMRREWLLSQPDGTDLLHIRLRFPDAASPAQLGMSVDPRRLGFSPATIRLEEP